MFYSIPSKPLLSLAFVWTFMGSVESQSTGCSTYCTDYHRICPAVQNPAFYNTYISYEEAGLVEEFGKNQDLPPMNCDLLFYKLACPMSCGECTSCSAEQQAQPTTTAQTPTTSQAATTTTTTTTPEPEPQPQPEAPVLTILSALSSDGSRPNVPIENAYDGNNSTERKDCFISEEMKEAFFTITRATVEQVYILGRNDDNLQWNMKKTVVQVCTGTMDCNPCGRVETTPAKGVFQELNCDAGAVGDTVKFTSQSGVKYLQFCEVIITGNAQ